MTTDAKPTTKRERNARKALQRSLRNTPPLTPNAPMKRKQRRLQARIQGVPAVPVAVEKQGILRTDAERMNVEQLRAILTSRGVAFTSKVRKPELIDMVAGASS